MEFIGKAIGFPRPGGGPMARTLACCFKLVGWVRELDGMTFADEAKRRARSAPMGASALAGVDSSITVGSCCTGQVSQGVPDEYDTLFGLRKDERCCD